MRRARFLENRKGILVYIYIPRINMEGRKIKEINKHGGLKCEWWRVEKIQKKVSESPCLLER